jgi:hypothetical protein
MAEFGRKMAEILLGGVHNGDGRIWEKMGEVGWSFWLFILPYLLAAF